jgi:AcrR family transcriptional regulator
MLFVMTRGQNHNREDKAKETRKKIVMAGVKLFARQGYHKTTIADLSRAIELTSGAIFHYFQSKEALLEAVLERLARGLKIYSDFTEQAEKGSFQVVEGLVTIMCDHFRRNPEATICLAALATEFAGSYHPMEQRIKEIYEIFVEPFARILRHHPKVVDPKAAAIAFMGNVQGIAIQGLLREQEQTIEQLAHAYLTMLLDW